MEPKALKELDELLIRDRILWKEKAKAQWLEEGDANTHFFHLSIVIRRKHNFIHYILDCENNRIIDYDQIAAHLISYYSNLFTSTYPSFPLDLQGLIHKTVSEDLNNTMLTSPSIAEVYKAVFSMENNKSSGPNGMSPGPDGMSPVFFKTYWNIVGKDLVSAVSDFF